MAISPAFNHLMVTFLPSCWFLNILIVALILDPWFEIEFSLGKIPISTERRLHMVAIILFLKPLIPPDLEKHQQFISGTIISRLHWIIDISLSHFTTSFKLKTFALDILTHCVAVDYFPQGLEVNCFRNIFHSRLYLFFKIIFTPSLTPLWV